MLEQLLRADARPSAPPLRGSSDPRAGRGCRGPSPFCHRYSTTPPKVRRTTPSRRPPRAICSGRLGEGPQAASSTSSPAGSRRTRSTSSPSRLRRLGRRLGEQDGQDAGDGGSAPARRRPAAAATWRCRRRRGRGRSQGGSTPSSARSYLGPGIGELGELRRVGAQVAGGQVPEPIAERRHHVTPPAAVPVASSDEPPPTSTTPIGAGRRGSPACACAPAKASARLLARRSRISTSTPQARCTAAHELVAVAAARIAAVATTRSSTHAVLARRARLRGHDGGHLGERSAAIAPPSPGTSRGSAHGGDLAQAAAVALGDQQPGRVRCRCRCSAQIMLVAIMLRR